MNSENTPSGRPNLANSGRLSTDKVIDVVALDMAMMYHTELTRVFGDKTPLKELYQRFAAQFRENPDGRKDHIQHQKAARRSQKLRGVKTPKAPGRVIDLFDRQVRTSR